MAKKTKDELIKEGMAKKKAMAKIKTKNDYIDNVVNGRYFLARCNMIVDQVEPRDKEGKPLPSDIKETVDGCPKPEEYLRAEYALTKVRAIKSMRNSHFAKLELKEEFGMTDEEIAAIEADYYSQKIIVEEVNETNKKE